MSDNNTTLVIFHQEDDTLRLHRVRTEDAAVAAEKSTVMLYEATFERRKRDNLLIMRHMDADPLTDEQKHEYHALADSAGRRLQCGDHLVLGSRLAVEKTHYS